MKIISQDANALVAVDKAYGTLVAGSVMCVVGLGLLTMGLIGRQGIVALIAAGVLVIGAVIVVLRKERTLTVDKGAGQVVFDLKSLLGKSSHQYAVGDVLKVEFTTSYRTTTTHTGPARSGISFGSGGGNGSTQTTQQTQVHLVLKDGTVIDLADGQRSMSALGIFSKVPNLEVARQIAAFLGVPFEQQGPVSLDQAVSQVRSAIMGQPQAPSVVPAQPAPSAEPTQPTDTQTPQP